MFACYIKCYNICCPVAGIHKLSWSELRLLWVSCSLVFCNLPTFSSFCVCLFTSCLCVYVCPWVWLSTYLYPVYSVTHFQIFPYVSAVTTLMPSLSLMLCLCSLVSCSQSNPVSPVPQALISPCLSVCLYSSTPLYSSPALLRLPCSSQTEHLTHTRGGILTLTDAPSHASSSHISTFTYPSNKPLLSSAFVSCMFCFWDQSSLRL